MSKMEPFACKTCPAFYECDKEGTAATAGGYETKVIDGENIVCCRPAPVRGRRQPMQQYAFYCLATDRGKKISGKADYTGRVPKWCPRREASK